MKKKLIVIVAVVALVASLALALTLGIGAAEAEPSLSIGGKSLILGNSIYLRYMVAAEGVADINDVSLLVWNEPQDAFVKGTEKYEVKWIKGTTSRNGITYYHFEFQDVAAKRLADDFYAVVYTKVGDKEYYSAADKYSVLKYAYNMMGKLDKAASTNTKLLNMLDAMLEYGATAQYYFEDYRTDRLANDDFYQVKTVGGKLPDGFTDGLYLEGDKVAITANAPAEGYEFVGWQKGSTGAIVSTEATATVEVGTANETYTAVYAKIHTVSFVDHDGTVIKTYNASSGKTVVAPDVAGREGYTFAGWQKGSTGEIISTEMNATVTVGDTDEVYTAVYEDAYSKGLSFEPNDDGRSYSVYMGMCEDTVIVIPPKYNGLPVTSIGIFGFGYYMEIEKVVIPASITTIGDWAFAGCSSLSTIEVDSASESFKVIDNVLYTKDGKNIVLYPGAKTDSEYTVPDGVEAISNYAFYNTYISTVTIPASVKTIGENAFGECYYLTDVIYDGTVSEWNNIAIDGGNELLLEANLQTKVSYSTGLTLTPISNNTAYAVANIGTCADEDVLIPPTYLDKPVTAILANAFAGANIKSVLISENITSIADGAFSDCYTLEAIDVDPLNTAYSSIDGNLYDKLGTKLIRYASGKTATSFTAPASVTEIAAEAFSGCNSITSVSIGASVNVIGERAFAYCPSLSDITVSSSNSKFSSKNGSLYNKNGTTLIAYAGSAKSFTIPSGVTEIGAYSFMNCTKLESVTFSNTVEVIGTAAFKGCTSLIKATLSDSVTVIESYAFADCIKLREITLGELINTVGDYAFSGCSSLAVVNYNNFEEEFKEINISKSGNAPLTSATKNYLKNDEVSDGVVGDTPIIGA